MNRRELLIGTAAAATAAGVGIGHGAEPVLLAPGDRIDGWFFKGLVGRVVELDGYRVSPSWPRSSSASYAEVLKDREVTMALVFRSAAKDLRPFEALVLLHEVGLAYKYEKWSVFARDIDVLDKAPNHPWRIPAGDELRRVLAEEAALIRRRGWPRSIPLLIADYADDIRTIASAADYHRLNDGPIIAA